MQRVFYIERGDLSWPVKAAQSLQAFSSIVLIFEWYNWDQRTKLHGTFKGYRIQKVAGMLPKEHREHTIDIWGQDWYDKVVRNDLVAYVQVTADRVRTSADPAPRSQTSKASEAATKSPTPVRFSNLELKRCNICGQELPKYAYFQRYYKESTDPRQGYCKVCQKYYLRWWNRGKQAGTGMTFRDFCEADPDWKFETQFRL